MQVLHNSAWRAQYYVAREQDALLRLLLSHEERHVVTHVPGSVNRLDFYAFV